MSNTNEQLFFEQINKPQPKAFGHSYFTDSIIYQAICDDKRQPLVSFMLLDVLYEDLGISPEVVDLKINVVQSDTLAPIKRLYRVSSQDIDRVADWYHRQAFTLQDKKWEVTPSVMLQKINELSDRPVHVTYFLPISLQNHINVAFDGHSPKPRIEILKY